MKNLSFFQICIIILLTIISVEGLFLLHRIGTVPTNSDLTNRNYIPNGIVGQLWTISNGLGGLRDIDDTLRKSLR